MNSIEHSFVVSKPADEVYKALTTIDGLTHWWTMDTIGSVALGDSIYFTFGSYATFEFQVALLDPGKLVSWKFLSGNQDWDNTHVTFVLEENEGITHLGFVHEGFSNENNNLGAVNFTWAGYLMSLREYCETGKGKPFSL